MPFHFPLQAVFHFRRSVEHQQEMLLRAAHQRVAGLRHLIDQLDGMIRQERTLFSQSLAAGTTAAELHWNLGKADSLQQQRQVLERELARVRNLRDQQQQIFRHARQEREVLERLRDRQWREYQRDESRREQRRLDELFLLRTNIWRIRERSQSKTTEPLARFPEPASRDFLRERGT